MATAAPVDASSCHESCHASPIGTAIFTESDSATKARLVSAHRQRRLEIEPQAAVLETVATVQVVWVPQPADTLPRLPDRHGPWDRTATCPLSGLADLAY